MFRKTIPIEAKSKHILQLRTFNNNSFHINSKKAAFIGGQGFTSKFSTGFRCIVANAMDVDHPFTSERNKFWRKGV